VSIMYRAMSANIALRGTILLRDLHKGNYDLRFQRVHKVPEINVENVLMSCGRFSYEEGAMIEPLACVIRAQRITE